MFIINNRWSTQKPTVGTQIDWGHPLAKGLVGCWVINEGKGKLIRNLSYGGCNFVCGNALPENPIVRTSVVAPIGSIFFSGMGTDALGWGAKGTTNQRLIQGNFTCIVSTSLIQGFSQTGYRTINLGERLGITITSSYIGDRIGYVNGGVAWRDSGITATVKRFYTLSFVYNNGNASFYIDGNLAINRAESWGLAESSTYSLSQLEIGSLNNCEIKYVYLFQKVFTLTEINKIRSEPYCFLKPIVRRFYSISGQAPTETRLLQKIIIPSNSKIGIRDGVKMVWRY